MNTAVAFEIGMRVRYTVQNNQCRKDCPHFHNGETGRIAGEKVSPNTSKVALWKLKMPDRCEFYASEWEMEVVR